MMLAEKYICLHDGRQLFADLDGRVGVALLNKRKNTSDNRRIWSMDAASGQVFLLDGRRLMTDKEGRCMVAKLDDIAAADVAASKNFTWLLNGDGTITQSGGDLHAAADDDQCYVLPRDAGSNSQAGRRRWYPPLMKDVFVTYSVQQMVNSMDVDVCGETLGDLRAALRQAYGILPFEQQVLYAPGGGEFVEIKGDDTVFLREKPGLLEVKELILVRQVDPRYKTEKETAFCEALAACRYQEAKDILQSSGITIDPSCVYKSGHRERVAVTECAYTYTHPALTVAIQAGLEKVVRCLACDAEKISAYMAREDEVCDVVQLMLEMKADVNATGNETQDCESAGCPTVRGKSPLCAAVQRGSPKLVRLLLDAKADPSMEHTYDQTAWGPDRHNPLGPGRMKPESWLREVCNGSVTARNKKDPRTANSDAILQMLQSAERQYDASFCGSQ